MKRRLAVLAAAIALSALTAGAVAVKLPKCASVKCRDLGCPSDVLCVSGSKVISCADVCNGH
ncbi:MAG TPA: hypothetical protein VJ826_15170 [Candidatus Polarisedimenticolaceae bacterium]|nr:hypothetical protein [Candidatus Polarisedimenticolaceae bacterium]